METVRAIMQVRTPIITAAGSFSKLAGVFSIEDEVVSATVPDGTLAFDKSDVAYVLVVCEDYEFDGNDQTLIVLN